MNDYVIDLDQLGMNDVDRVGGKNASLGEMIRHLADSNVVVPGGFATTAHAYREFLATDALADRINQALSELDVDDVNALARTGAQIRQWVMDTPFPAAFERTLAEEFAKLEAQYGTEVTWAVRSSATAEDLPDASFAGQQETFLNVSGYDAVKQAIHEVFASLFNDRAIAYRVHQGFDHSLV
ncbi:MAG: hypothetical protein RLZ44_781, partial [Pseudomonadota bacterium]